MGTECYLINLDRKEAFCLGKYWECLFPFPVDSGYATTHNCFGNGIFKITDCYPNAWTLSKRMLMKEIDNYPNERESFLDEFNKAKEYYKELAEKVFTWAGDCKLSWRAHEDGWNADEAEIIFDHCTESVYYG